jgi:MFS family permease
LAALRSRDFRLLWVSQSVSVLGDALVIVAIGLFVTRLTDRAADVAVVLAAYAAPLVVFVLIGGVVADRLPRQTVMVVSDLARAVLHGVLAVLIATGTVRIWQMVVIGLLYGTAEAFFRPAYSGLVPQTVSSDEDIQGAQALGGLSASWLISQAPRWPRPWCWASAAAGPSGWTRRRFCSLRRCWRGCTRVPAASRRPANRC